MAPRIWNRREFDVTQAGYFTVLRPTGWFSATRLPGGFRYLINPIKRKKTKPAPSQTAGPATDVPLRIAPPEQDRHPVRFALIALSAAAITSALLLWVQNP